MSRKGLASFTRVLVATRGEPACRVIRSVERLGLTSVGVATPSEAGDGLSLHWMLARKKVELRSERSFLEANELAATAAGQGCEVLHPGIGFLSESWELADACADRGVTFAGPNSTALKQCGDKVAARELAEGAGLQVAAGAAVSTAAEAADVAASIFRSGGGKKVLLKSRMGGGGVGIRGACSADVESVRDAFEAAHAEGMRAFGDGRVLVEQALEKTRHVEVQLAVGWDEAIALGTRDCSLQRRRRKLVEMAPAPGVDESVPETLALKLAEELRRRFDYRGLATVEFLWNPVDDVWWFLEVNPRLQVEHCVTESIYGGGLDLVETQLRIAAGESVFDAVGRDSFRKKNAFAVSSRLSATSFDAPIQAFVVPPDVRCDACWYGGLRVNPRFDPLLAKLIAVDQSWRAAVDACRRALQSTKVLGPATNQADLLAILDAVLAMQDDTINGLSTTFLEEHLPEVVVDDDQEEDGENDSASASGETAVRADRDVVVVEVLVSEGDTVAVGDPLVLVSAVKLEEVVYSPRDGVVKRVVKKAGASARKHATLVVIASVDASTPSTTKGVDSSSSLDRSWAPELEDMAEMATMAKRHGGRENVRKHEALGKLTARARIEAVLDPDSFREIGGFAGAAQWDRETGRIVDLRPHAFVGGAGTISGRRVYAGADDFTSKGGHVADKALLALSLARKQAYIEARARAEKAPMLRLLDGASGGGSVATILDMGYNYLPPLLGFEHKVRMLDEVPVISLLLGPVVGFGAARAVASHAAIMVREQSQLFVAGPPVVKAALGIDVDKNSLGGAHVHGTNGAVDIVVDTEAEAFTRARALLAYLPSSASEPPPRTQSKPPLQNFADRIDTLIPRRRGVALDGRTLIHALVDEDSFLELGAGWGQSVVTGLARMDGLSVVVVANDGRFDGGALTAASSAKQQRLCRLANTFNLPILNLVDNPGFAVGPDREREATIRAGVDLVKTLYELRSPYFALVVRKCFGVGGAAQVDCGTGNPASLVNWRAAWPSAESGSLPLDGGVVAAFKRDIQNAPDPDRALKELTTAIDHLRSPLRTAAAFNLEDLIAPRDTRALLLDWLHNVAYRHIHLRCNSSRANSSQQGAGTAPC